MGPRVHCLRGQMECRGEVQPDFASHELCDPSKLVIFSELYLAAFFGVESEGLISSASLLPVFPCEDQIWWGEEPYRLHDHQAMGSRGVAWSLLQFAKFMD